MRMEIFKYSYLEGPVERPELMLDKKIGNCRFAVQVFYYKYFGRFLRPEDILLPEAYKNVGEFIFKEEKVDFDGLEVGDVIYAKKRFDSKGRSILKEKEEYESEDEWILYSHCAVYLGEVSEKIEEMFGENYKLEKDKLLIWHATGYSGESCVWGVEEFIEKYEVMAVKRLCLS